LRKIAFLFPGQGSQEIGMGIDIIKKYPEADELFQTANLALNDEGIDLRKICIAGPEEELNNTTNAQPAILTLSMMIYQLLKKNEIKADILAGHSLGEYSALVAASSIDFKEAVKLVRKRGEYMQNATPKGFGTMAAIISLRKEEIENLIKEVSEYGCIEVANYNSPYQIVVSGESIVINKLFELGGQVEEINVVPLKVSAPFHSSFMSKAKNNLAEYLEYVNIKNPKIPTICNLTADYVQEKNEIRHALIEQLTNPVRWVEIINRMISDGINYFIEVGPGDVLKKLVRQIIPWAKVFNVNDLESLQKLIHDFKKYNLTNY
jgi:[acyl-carrier-protein] S-malonyltransferase